ncbi:MAG TPA: hypothetical protein DHW82_07450 [Spirochaetia bacterium]|nr:MAG: hypothetical protein A2Y41_12265 [Spirochaetes bacterium GWB1_36_13]HCL56828.1 hypothetical protein [Spirochaetia bacterium]
MSREIEILIFEIDNRWFGILENEIDKIFDSRQQKVYEFYNQFHIKEILKMEEILKLKTTLSSCKIIVIQLFNSDEKIGIHVPETIELFKVNLRDVFPMPEFIFKKLKIPLFYGIIESNERKILLLSFYESSRQLLKINKTLSYDEDAHTIGDI